MQLEHPCTRLHFRGGIRSGEVCFQIERHHETGPIRHQMHEWRDENNANSESNMSTWFTMDQIITSLSSIIAGPPEIRVITFEYWLIPDTSNGRYINISYADAIDMISPALHQMQRKFYDL